MKKSIISLFATIMVAACINAIASAATDFVAANPTSEQMAAALYSQYVSDASAAAASWQNIFNSINTISDASSKDALLTGGEDALKKMTPDEAKNFVNSICAQISTVVFNRDKASGYYTIIQVTELLDPTEAINAAKRSTESGVGKSSINSNDFNPVNPKPISGIPYNN